MLYLRKSRGRAGISRQRVITTAHIEGTGGTILAEFKDTDRTAFQKVNEARPTREGFDALIAFMRAHPGVGVAAWHADRLTRNDDDTATLMSVCEAGGHLIETPRGGTYNLATATGRKRLRDDASDAIYEVDHMTERITAAKAEARAAGVWLGGRRPFGYQVDRDTPEGEPPRLLELEAEADLIRRGTKDVIGKGTSLAAITRAWNASGLKTSGGNPWTNREVSRVLRRARNAGIAEHDGQEAGPGQWPALVAEEDWRACKAILESPGRRTSPGNQPRWLLSGIAVCGVCGTPVICQSVAGKGRPPRLVYRDRPAGERGHVWRDVAETDAYVSELVIGWLDRYGRDALAPEGPDVSEIAGQQRALRAELDSLTEAAEQRAINAMQLIKASRPINEQIRYLDGLLAQTAASATVAHLFTTGDIRATWARAGLAAQRTVIRELMEITILRSPRGRPAGREPGKSYFRPETVRVEWKREPQ